VRAPKANSVCERFGGTMRRECLDYLIPFNERHLRFVLKAWIAHFNSARPHMSLGPGIPSGLLAAVPPRASGGGHRCITDSAGLPVPHVLTLPFATLN
jgi:putative transposase